MTNAPAPYRDPDATLRQLRARILGGARPPLESLGRDEMAAANRMISTGEAEIANYSCRLFLIAKLRDEPGGLDGLRALSQRWLGKA